MGKWARLFRLVLLIGPKPGHWRRVRVVRADGASSADDDDDGVV